ncbi:MAG TPA: HupE/UreJ family protein [Pirellulales bacterium]|jgi:urease accessory protein|nr:HupE/UreJ family protein [Pirellulales bacterium]
MTNRHRTVLATLAAMMTLAVATPALAHPGHGGHEFADGWAHPFSGLDHLLAMIAVGLLAVRMGGKAIWIMPCTFIAAMLAGGGLAALGVPMPGAEWWIAASVLALGVMVAATGVIPLKYGAALVALFAVFHGHAHVHELLGSSAAASIAPYAIGFVLATAILHASGIAIGLGLRRWGQPMAMRVAGGMITAAGLLILCGIIQV